MKCRTITFLALLALGAAGGKDDRTPVERVVNMLTDLQGKIVADGKAEQNVYNKYACWCEKTTARKAADITTAENDLRSLGQQILKLKGKVATLAAEIKELEGKIDDNEEEQGEATSLRSKRNGKFMARQQESKEALAALEKAIAVLVTGSTKLLQTDSAVQATSAVQNVLDRIPSEAPLNNDHMAFLSEFVKNGADGTYAPQSATIQGILTDTYETFSSDLETATMTEATQNKNYEKLTATLQQEAIDLKDTKSRKEDQKADAESDLADTTATYDDTQDQMKADIKFFDQTKDACDSKHEEWTLRDKLREEELAGVEKALGFLSSDEARDLFAKSIKPGVEAASFLQIEDAQAVSFKAYGMLKAQATKTKSLRLAMLAVRVRTAKAGHFDKVIKAIDDMVVTLNDEADADREKKNQCNNEYQQIARTVSDLDWKIKNNEAKIDKLEKLIEMRTEEREATINQMDDTKDYQKKITDDRKEEHEAFQNAQSDDKAAVILLNTAKDALTAFYDKNKVDMGEIQGSVKLLQDDPAFAVSQDQAPEASFSGKGNRKGMSKGIVSLMDYVIEDLEDEIVNDGKSEAKNQADFEGEMNTANELLKDLDAKKVSLEDIISKRKTEKADEIADKKSNNKDRDAENKYKDKITPDCDWILKAFDGRASARNAEMSGLVSAKEYLAGKTSLLQLKTEAPIKAHAAGADKLASITFLHVH